MRVFNLESLIEKSKSIYNEKYDYSNTVYVNAKIKCIFKCKIHNIIFEQTPNHHFTSIGCSLCSLEEKKSKVDQLYFENKSKSLYGDIFIYDNYISAKTEIEFKCKIHNYKFYQTPNDHYSYNGCLECRAEVNKNKFIKKANIVHNNKYDYGKIEQYKNLEKVSIICPEHGEFKQTPNSHIQGKGCPSCSKTGFDYNSTGHFYVQEILKDDICIAYKFGIAKNIKKRMINQKSKSKLEHKLIYSFESTGMEVYRLEQIIKTTLSCNYLDKSVLPDGYTETLSPEDILTLENIIMDFLLGDKHE